MGLIHTKNLSVDARLKPLTLTVSQGELVGIIGPNGSGKSTFLQTLLGLVSYQGDIFMDGKNISQYPAKVRAQKISYLAQRSELHWSLSVEDVVSLGRAPWDFQEMKQVTYAMNQCNVLAFKDKDVNRLSGGEQTRVHLARALATGAQLLCADEPLASLDFLYQKQVMEILRNYAKADCSVLVAIHDLGMAARYCDKLCLLDEGNLLAYGSPQEVLTPSNLQQAYGVAVKVDLTATPPIVLAL